MKLFQVIFAIFAMALATPTAFADKRAEDFVQQNANAALSVLNDKALSSSQRQVKFGEYMDKFASMEGIARRVLGNTARSLSDGEFQRYFSKFRAYTLGVYQQHFDQFRGESLRVTGSKPGNRAQQWFVESTIKSSRTGKDTKVYWDVILMNDGKTFRVRDVGVDLDGVPRWLAAEQTEQFSGLLNAPGGSLDVLMRRMDELIAKSAS